MIGENLLEAFRKHIDLDTSLFPSKKALPALLSDIQCAFAFLFLIENVCPEKSDVDAFFLNYVSHLFESRRMTLSHLVSFLYAPRFFKNLQRSLEFEIRAKRLSFLLTQSPMNELLKISTHELPSYLQQRENRMVEVYLEQMKTHGSQLQLHELFQVQRQLVLRKIFTQHSFFVFLYSSATVGFITLVFLIIKGDSNHLFESILAWIDFLKNFFGALLP